MSLRPPVGGQKDREAAANEDHYGLREEGDSALTTPRNTFRPKATAAADDGDRDPACLFKCSLSNASSSL